MTLSAEELGIRVVLISCTWLLSIQTTQFSPFLHNQGEIVWTCCVWEIQVSTSGFELEFSPPQLNALPLSYDANCPMIFKRLKDHCPKIFKPGFTVYNNIQQGVIFWEAFKVAKKRKTMLCITDLILSFCMFVEIIRNYGLIVVQFQLN